MSPPVGTPDKQTQMDFLKSWRLQMAEEFLAGDPGEQKYWWAAVVLSLVVIPLATIGFAAFSLFFSQEKTVNISQHQDITRIIRIKLQPPKAVKKPSQIKLKLVPIPDPTPDEPEPIVPHEEAEIELPDDIENIDILSDIPSTPPDLNDGPIVIGVNGIPPKPIRKVDPIYPEAARRLHLEGIVILKIVVNKDGSVGDVRVLRSPHPLLDQAAIEAAHNWKFLPGRINERPVDAYYILTVKFALTAAG